MRAKLFPIGILGFIIAGAAIVCTAGDEKVVPPARDVSAFQAATTASRSSRAVPALSAECGPWLTLAPASRPSQKTLSMSML